MSKQPEVKTTKIAKCHCLECVNNDKKGNCTKNWIEILDKSDDKHFNPVCGSVSN